MAGGRKPAEPADPAGRVRTARPSRAEAAAWLLFSAGGMVSALLVPVLVLLFGVLFPLGVLAPPDHAGLAALLGHPLVRILLLGLCVLALLHWAHRFRYTLFDGLQLDRFRGAITVLCYAAALAGSVWAAFVLLG
jgi:fumarate reductase subunit D